METKQKVLIVDDDPNIRQLLEINLQEAGYLVSSVDNGTAAIEIARNERPEIILLDVMLPELSGYQVVENLKRHRKTALIPIIMITAKDKSFERIAGLKKGADDYITKPFNIEELLLKVRNTIYRANANLYANPLTMLPGSPMIAQKVDELIKNSKPFAFAYVDINHFKSYNDKYGYARGDKVIKLTAEIIEDVISQSNEKEHFIGHIGGDDFVFIAQPQSVEKISAEIIKKFDTLVLEHYDTVDRKNKTVNSINRSGQPEVFPVVSVSIGIVTNTTRALTSYGEVAYISSEMKTIAKLQKKDGGSYAIDKRKI